METSKTGVSTEISTHAGLTITTGLYAGLEGLVLSEHPGICTYVRLGDSYSSKLGDICVDWQDYLRARKNLS